MPRNKNHKVCRREPFVDYGFGPCGLGTYFWAMCSVCGSGVVVGFVSDIKRKQSGEETKA